MIGLVMMMADGITVWFHGPDRFFRPVTPIHRAQQRFPAAPL
jgi:hypothetical protein